MPPLKWGIISAGKICNDFCNALRHAGAEIQCVGARDEEEASDFAQRHKIPQSGSYDFVLKHPEVDVVYIGTIHPLHRDLVCRAAEAGKHVVCEKPLGMNAREVQEMQAAARENNVFLLEGMWTRFFPIIKKVKYLARVAKVVGEIRHVQADFGIVSTLETAPRMWIRRMGGGGLLDIGIYPVAAALWAFPNQAATEVKVIGGVTMDNSEGGGLIDTHGMVSLGFEGGQSASLSYSMVNTTPEEVILSGTSGYIRIHGPAHCPQKFSVHRLAGRSYEEEVFEEKYELIETLPGCEFCHPGSEGFVHEIRAVEEAIAAGKQECDEYTWADSLRVTEIMDQVRSELDVIYAQD